MEAKLLTLFSKGLNETEIATHINRLPPVLRTAGNAAPHNTLIFLHFGYTNGTKVPSVTLAKPHEWPKGKKKKKKKTTCFNRFAPLKFYITSAYLKDKNFYNPVSLGKLNRESIHRSWACSPLRTIITQLNAQCGLIKSRWAYKRPWTRRGATEYPNVALKPLKDRSKDALLWPKKFGTGTKQAQLL